MNPIDKMLLQYAGKIEIRLVPNPEIFYVVFSAPPSPEVLSPLLSLIETKRFKWTNWTEYCLKKNKLSDMLELIVEAVNVIPASEAIAALKQMWEELGYEVKIVPSKYSSDGAIKVSFLI